LKKLTKLLYFNFCYQKNIPINTLHLLLTGLAEWYEPNGGMFLWLKIIGLNDAKQLVTKRCLEKLIILAPGYALSTNTENPSPYIRISYSIASPEEVDRVSFIFFIKVIFAIFLLIFLHSMRITNSTHANYG